MKPGESRVSEGPKNERTELNEKLESQTEQSAEAVGSGNCGHYPKGKALARRCGRRHPGRASWQGPRGSARLNTESEVREPDGMGSSCHQISRPPGNRAAAFNRGMRKTARPEGWEGA